MKLFKFLILSLSSSLALSLSLSAISAASNPGNIIDDARFTDVNTMSVRDVQEFLDSKITDCDPQGLKTSEFGGGTRAQWAAARGHKPPFTCINSYKENGKSAAQIIIDAAKEFQINPQVFIVLLQKEQGLITDNWPLEIQYKTATGYGCPDTAPCDSEYFGLTNQVRWAGRMFRSIMNNSPGWYTPYILGNNFIQWHPNKSCGGTTVNIQNRATQALYNYTPYQPNRAALNAGYGKGDSCSSYGNRNFYLYFKDWFGNYNRQPAAFKTSNSGTIYIPVQGQKIKVPHMATLQDYGISPQSIQTVSQSYVDSIPSPTKESEISQSISHVVKSPRDDDEDGGSIYLITRNYRYQFRTMEQFFSYGFKESEISYLPLSYILQKQNKGMLPNFIASPKSVTFKIDGNTKRIIFDYKTFIKENPSDQTALLSYYLVDRIPSGNPITSGPTLIKKQGSEDVRLYDGSSYYAIPNYDTLKCWGLDTKLNLPVYRVAQNNYISNSGVDMNLSCLVTDSSSRSYLMNGNNKVSISPNSTMLSLNSELTKLSARIPTRSEPLSNLVKLRNNAAIWHLDDGSRRLIPTYSSYQIIQRKNRPVDTVSSELLNHYQDAGILLADSQSVKEPSSAGVYGISDGKKFLFSSSLFLAYGNGWDEIQTLSKKQLDINYPTAGNASSIMLDPSKNTIYFASENNCYTLSGTNLSNFGYDVSAMRSLGKYMLSTAYKKNISKCKQSTQYIRSFDNPLVYRVENGVKKPIHSLRDLLSMNGGKEPEVMRVSLDVIQNLK